jgi:hypothetical protein
MSLIQRGLHGTTKMVKSWGFAVVTHLVFSFNYNMWEGHQGMGITEGRQKQT